MTTNGPVPVGFPAAMIGAGVGSIVVIVLAWVFPALRNQVLGVPWAILILVPVVVASMAWCERMSRARRSDRAGDGGDD